MNTTHYGFNPTPPVSQNRTAQVKFEDGVHCSFYDAIEVGLYIAFFEKDVSTCFLSRDTLIIRPQSVPRVFLFGNRWNDSTWYPKTCAQQQQIEEAPNRRIQDLIKSFFIAMGFETFEEEDQ